MSRNIKTDTKTLPRSGKEATFRGLTGYEEDMLTDKKLAKGGKALDEILFACVTEIDGEKPSKSTILGLPSSDRVFLLVQIRILSYGEVINGAQILCSRKDCTDKTYVDINLAELPLKIAEDTDLDKEYSVTLPETGAQVKYRDLFGTDEAKLLKVAENELLSIAMMIRLTEVVDEGKTIHPNDYRRWIKELPVADRTAIRKSMEENQVGIDTTITVECDECGTETKVRAEQLQSFFFPEM